MDNAAWFTGGRYGGARSGMGGAAPSALPSWPVVDPYEPGFNRQNWSTSPMHNEGYAVMDQPYINYMNWLYGQRDFRAQERQPVPMPTSPFKVNSPFHRYADSWMRDPAIGSRIEGFDPDQSYGYVDPRRMDALRQRGGGRFG